MPRTLKLSTIKTFMAITCLAVSAQAATAQAKASGGSFGLGSTDIGPVVGLGGIGGAGASFGGRFEHVFKALPDLANGLLGIQVAADYYSWSSGAGLFNYSIKYIPVGGTLNYHFKLDEPKLDPFIGLGLGYNIVSCSFDGNTNVGCGYDSALYFIGRAGARYFFSPKMAVYGDLGAGGATVNLGVMFKM